MLQHLLICDTAGFPFYARNFNGSEVDSTLLSGLISAIGSVGRHLFKKEIATISFGDEDQIVVVTKDLFASDTCVNFVFICSDDYDLKQFRQIATRLFIEIKPFLKYKQPDVAPIKNLADKILVNQFSVVA